MADVNAEIGVNIDTTAALAQLKSLQRQISQFHTSIARSSDTAALAQKSLQKNFLNSVNAIGSFSAELRTVKTTTESFTSSLEGNKFSMREYFRYAGGATKTFGKLFKSEFDTIGKVAEERVKRLQTQYIKMGRDASGAMQAISITPTSLNMQDYGTKTAIAAQKQALFNQLMKQGSTNLLNFGKNTQWAGRQLMVGFTIPLAMVGSAATKTFMDMEAQAIKFKKVYGDLFTPKAETQQALDDIIELGKSFTQYGVAVSTTVGLAAEAAAAGFAGIDLQRQTTQATRLSILGQIDNQKALETTISLQNAFGMSSDKLADSINFLNAVENQTVVSLDDITTAIPKVAPVIQQLGGDVKDLAFFLTAMKEGGINASEGANALKSGLAAMINPTGKASAMLEGFGINIRKIVTDNKGDLKATVVEFATALNQLDPLNRAQAIEQMFGKFQFARLSTLFANVAKDGNQAARVLDLANSSVEELSALSEQELGMTAESSMNKFKKTVEDLKIALVPVGKAFLEAVTPIVEFVGNILEKFGNLSDGTKKAITLMVTVVGGLGPILLMTFGLLANGVANIMKLFLTLRNGYLRLTGQSQILGEQTQYLTMEQIDAAAASHSLNQAHATLTQQFTVEASAVMKLKTAYEQATAAGARFAMNNPGSMIPRGKGYANGVVSVPGSGKGDTVPAMLTPGEAIIPAAMAKKYAPLINGMVAGNIPGYETGRGVKGFKNATIYLQEAINTAMGGSGQGAKMADVLGSLKQSGGAAAAPLLAVIASSIGEKLNDPNNYDEYSKIGDTLINAAINALESSGKEFIKDLDLEQIVVPAMQEAAKGLSVAGIDIKEALDRAIQEIRTVAPIGVASGSAGGQGRTNLPGSYRATGKIAQEFAMKKNPSKFDKKTVPSQSKGTKQVFKMLDVNSDEYVTATMAHIMPSINASMSEIESRISAYVPNAAARLEKIGAESGKKVGKATADGVAKGAKTASPSKDTIKTGEDIGKGLEIGLESRKDEVTAAGTNLGKAATQSVSRGARSTGPITPGEPYNIQKTQGGIPISQITKNAPVPPEIAQKASLQARMMQISTDRLQNFDRKMMGASFAISSLSSIASMSGGKLGAMSGVIAKVTGALFALQAITSLLTQAKILELAQSRLGMASTAMKMAKGTQGPGMVGVAGKAGVKGASSMMGSLARVGLGLTKFLGPIGIATTAATVLYMGFKFYKKKQDEAALAIEGLGKAANLSKTQLEKLGTIYGFTPKDAKFSLTPTVKGVVGEQRQKVEETKTLYATDKEFQDTVTTLKTASKEQADIIFKSMAITLLGQGANEEAINSIIVALQETAGKTDVKFDFKSINLNTEKGQKALNKSLKTVLGNYNKNFKREYDKVSKSTQAMADNGTATITEARLKKSLAFSSGVVASNIKSLQVQLQNGTISGENFAKSFNAISTSIQEMPQANALYLIGAATKELSPELQKVVGSLGNVSDKLLVIQALTMGIGITQAQIDQLNYQGGTSQNADKMRKQILAQMAAAGVEMTKAYENQVKAFEETDSSIAEKSPFQQGVEQLQNQTKEISNTVKSYDMLTKAGVGAGKAFEVAKDPILAAAVATTKVGTDAWKKLLKLIKETDAALIKSKLTELKADTAYTEQFTKIVPVLQKLGLNAEEIDNIFSDPSFAQQFIKGIKDGKMKTEDLNKLINQTVKNRKVKIEFDTSKLTEDEKFDKAMAEANDMFDKLQSAIEDSYSRTIIAQESEIEKAQDKVKIVQDEIDGLQLGIDKSQRDLEINITRKIEGFQQDIEKLQDKIKQNFDIPLGKLSDEGDILSNNLSLIDRQTSKINEKYDAQAAALTKISEINSEISGEQKQQLGLADALSRGDIAAAAAAAQEMRATAAANAIGKQSGVLDAARNAELAKVSVNGMTKEGIEERQFQISQQSFALQQQRKTLEQEIANIEKNQIAPLNVARLAAEKAIRDEQDKIYAIEKGKLAEAQKALKEREDELTKTNKQLKADLDVINQKKAFWVSEKIARDAAFIEQEAAANKYKGILTKTDEIAKGIIAKLATTVTTIHNIHTVYTSSGSAGSGSGRPTGKMYGGKIMAMNYGGRVPKYMASGGRVGSDTVPAMLTPGEFVMNKGASKRFGPMLEAMNNSKYPSMIKDLTPTTYSSVTSSVSMPISSSLSSTVNDNSSTMYNYNIGISVPQSNASSNDIARAVISQIKYIDSQRIRGQK